MKMQNNECKIDINTDNCETLMQELYDKVEFWLFDATDLQIDNIGTDVDVIVASFERAW